jgi:beta-1,4-mannosyl-glycoprotein beta-1,4-N-acetylglucosaminyltransferase
MIRDELGMFQLRCEEMAGYDVTHVVVEARADHQGHPKPLHFAENRERFAPWAGRIIHIAVDDLPDDPNPWVREHAQRDRALAALADAAPGDRVLIADVDEIPSREALEARPRPAAALQQNVCAFAVDWLAFKELTSVIATAAYVQAQGSLAAVRDMRGTWPVIWDGGWHFTWMGGREACLEKLGTFCHTESAEIVRRGIGSGDFIKRGRWTLIDQMRLKTIQLEAVDVDGRWPAMIRERRCPPGWFRPR